MKKNEQRFILSSLLMLVLTIVSLPLMTFVYGGLKGIIIRNSVFSIFFALGFFYFYHYFYHYDLLDYDNKEHPYRFMYTYIVSIILSVLFPLVDKKAWIFLSIGIALALFSNAYIAFYSVAGMIIYTVLLSPNPDIITFCVYFFAAFIGIVLFYRIDKSFKVGYSIFMSVIILTVLEISGFVLLENEKLNAEQFIMPIANVFINSLTLMFVLKYFNQAVANKYRNKYSEINDQEYEALIRLKETAKEEYYRSIHTAYLAERMAVAINCNVDVAKNCAYYHRIISLFHYSYKECEKFVVDNEFPPEAQKLLLKYIKNDSLPEEKEACIVYISDKLIWTLMSLFAKNKDIKIDYSSLINTLFDKNYINENLSNSDLSQKDLKIIKEILLKETLYYDFLR